MQRNKNTELCLPLMFLLEHHLMTTHSDQTNHWRACVALLLSASQSPTLTNSNCHVYLLLAPQAGKQITAVVEVEYLLDCDILFNVLAVNDEVERIVFCSGEVMKGQTEYSSPQKQSFSGASVCLSRREKWETGRVWRGVCRVWYICTCVSVCQCVCAACSSFYFAG